MKALLSLISLGFSCTLSAQIISSSIPPLPVTDLSKALPLTFPAPDLQAIAKEDSLNDIRKDKPWRFGIENMAGHNVHQSGSWSQAGNTAIWQMEVHSAGATSLNYFFDEFFLPPTGKLYVIDKATGAYFGAITPANNNSLGTLSTWPFRGDRHLLQLEVDQSEKRLVKLNLKSVTHGYRLLKDTEGIGTSGPCQRNAACPEGDPWASQKRSVLMIVVNNNGICTGTLINNTLNNGRPYVLTAQHCTTGNLSGWSFRFNHQSPTCDDREFIPEVQGISGAVLRAVSKVPDFALVEMATTPPPTYNPYFAGWDRSDEPTDYQFVIHHPDGDLKKISFNNNPATKAFYNDLSSGQNVWRIDKWESGSTEGGSSGSALFDPNGRIIGHLTGGSASCFLPNNPDFFGRLAIDFISNQDSTKTLSYWLDPGTTSTRTLDGYDPSLPRPATDAALLGMTKGSQPGCSNRLNAEVVVYNNGTQPLTEATIEMRVDGLHVASQPFTGSLNKGKSEIVQLPEVVLSEGVHEVEYHLVNPNNAVDEFPLNNVTRLRIITVPSGDAHTFRIVLDDFGTENTWEILNADSVVMDAGGPYNDYERGKAISQTVCLSPGCYTLKFHDAYGDGICCQFGQGRYYFIHSNGDTLVSDNAENSLLKASGFCISQDFDDRYELANLPADKYLEIRQEKEAELVIRIFNLAGQLAGIYKGKGTYLLVPTEQLPAGIYVTEISDGIEMVTKKFPVIHQ